MFPTRIEAGQYKRPKLHAGSHEPFRWFNAGQKIDEAYVVSSFGILTFAAMRKRTLDGAWLQCSVFQHIRQMVNSFPLEEIGANTTPSVTLKNNEPIKRRTKNVYKLLKRLLAYTNANGLHFTGRVQCGVYWYD
jgi:hypothetical protein